jgi:peptide/nickel transport system permease protein
VMAWLMITATLIIIFNLIADILYGLLDPRVRYD